MIENLPRPIALYIEAENSGDTNLFDQCFTEDATVRDENETHEGLAAIKKWKAETKRKYQHTVDPLKIVEQGGKFIVTSRLAGNFPGSPIELDFAFTLSGDKIVSLEILS
jgi:SnoaL-like domain